MKTEEVTILELPTDGEFARIVIINGVEYIRKEEPINPNDLDIKLFNGTITNIEVDECYSHGCETCDYGSSYVRTAFIYLKDNTLYKCITIETNQMYEYLEGVSIGNLITILTNIDYSGMTVEGLARVLEKEFEDAGDCFSDYKCTVKLS